MSDDENIEGKVRVTGGSVIHYGLAWPLASAEQLGAVFGVTPTFVRQIQRETNLEKAGRNLFDPIKMVGAYIERLRSENTKNTRSAESRRVQELRAKQLEIQIAKETGELLPMKNLLEVFADVLGTFRSELGGLAASATRDNDLRAKIEENLNSCMDRCKERFAKKSARLKKSGGKFLTINDDED